MKHNQELEKIRDEVEESYQNKKRTICDLLEKQTAEYVLAWGTESLVLAEILSEQVFIVVSKLLKLDSIEKQIEFCKTWRENASRDLMSALRAMSQNSNEMHNTMQKIRLRVRGSFLAPGEQYSLSHIENVLETALQAKQKGVL
jgi:hypothetical protein